MGKINSTVVRDFSGGLNVVDDDLNLSSEFQPVLDNVHRGVDNTLSVRWGTELFMDLRRGSVLTGTPTFTVSWTIATRTLTCSYTSHGLLAGDHITFTAGWANMTGILSAEIIGKPFGVRIINANQFTVDMLHAATVSGSDAGAKAITKDTHFLAGDILEVVYYNDHLVVFDTAGEVVKINAAMTVTRIWDSSKSYALAGGESSADPGPGWSSPIDYVSTAIFKGQLIACNGVDKPLLIDFSATPNATYLADVGSSYSTIHVPVGKYVCSLDRWLVIAGDPLMPYAVHISATDSSGTWEEDTDSDGVHLEMNNTNSSSLFIRGINRFRNLLAVAFDDTVAFVELGIFDAAVHRPEVSDSIARHGAIAHKSMVFLGFDLVMADPVGVPSFAKSQFDSSVIPSRMSELISPMIQKNISRLTAYTLENKVFSVYSTHDNRYVLFAPNYDNVAYTLPRDPIFYIAELVGTNRGLLHTPNHGMEEGDQFSITSDGPTPDIPATCIVDTIVNENFISFTLNTTILEAKNYGGNASITRIQSETTAYAFTYNKGLKIKAWSRYRGWNFRAGCTSLYGRVFLASRSKIWRMGNRFDPIYADFRGMYDRVYAISTAYTVGQRVKDEATNEVYTCMIANTSSTGSFMSNRDAFPNNWERYEGEPINFAIEFPWADFDKRDMTKLLKGISVDAKGTERFNVDMYLDYYYKHKLTGERTPQLSMDMVGGDKGAYGVAAQTYGVGRMAIRQRMWPFEARGKLFKLRLSGAAKLPLRFIAFIFNYKLVGRDR